ncbi:sigma-70 family RNA polymerase sigma factor [Thiofilum flexile]|uniref:sigma-70 family RNA polymerase sigma factor n=1 Tax=Thiofilum flexile TaxID=125627 RepID=UPI000379DA10|nr:sigma-70 family RNA polymerase sigma factor [Thiofilum flexile]
MPNALEVIARLLRSRDDRSEDNDATLVKAVLHGERTAFDQLVIRYHELAYGLAYRMVQQPELAEDIVQDCFVKVWQQAGQWQPEQGKFSTWLYQIVRHQSLDELRSAAHRYNEPLAAEDELAAPQQIEAVFEHQQQQAQFQQALSQLNIDQRTAIALVYQTGLSNKVAAQVMDLQLKAFESLLGRAKFRLKQQLGESNER